MKRKKCKSQIHNNQKYKQVKLLTPWPFLSTGKFPPKNTYFFFARYQFLSILLLQFWTTNYFCSPTICQLYLRHYKLWCVLEMSWTQEVTLHCEALGIYQHCSKPCSLGIKCLPSYGGRGGIYRGTKNKQTNKKINLYFTRGETEGREKPRSLPKVPQRFECMPEQLRGSYPL